ncbi:MAG: exopolysaccharide biosynthesis polyprenyl glycosylphosphotransferase [Pseudomonadota bacterium]
MEVVLPTAIAGGLVLSGAAIFAVTQLSADGVQSSDGRVYLDQFDSGDLETPNRVSNHTWAAFAKRCLDVILSLMLLLISSPLLALVAVLIKLESAGPVFYKQTRVGLDGKHFEIIKFRSMQDNAEAQGVKWAVEDDPRVTKLGKYLRHFRIDEVPQVINVIRGDMSFVGPRPERPEFVDILDRKITNYSLRHSVKPGITGWAQVKHEYAASVEGSREKLRFDLFYIRNYSLALDIVIVLLTIRVALFGLGSR